MDKDNTFYCLVCDGELNHFSGLGNIPEFYYCPLCNDVAFDIDGTIIGEIE